MGLGGISIWQLIIILVIVMLIFGTKKMRNIGSDLGGAIKGFKESMGDDKKADSNDQERVIEGEKADDADSKEQEKDTDKTA